MKKKNPYVSIVLPQKTVRRVLKLAKIEYERSRMPNDAGWRLDLLGDAYDGVNINVYDSKAVVVQGEGHFRCERLRQLFRAQMKTPGIFD